jgi:hypothetical protein
VKKRDRKQLIQAYHETARPMGVYRIASVRTGHGIVGTSRDLTAILNRHRAQLGLGSHPDKALQEEWDEAGQSALAFEVLDTLEPSDDPAYDPTADLDALLTMWEERLAQEE